MNISLIEEAGILSSYRNQTNFMISLNIVFSNGGKKNKIKSNSLLKTVPLTWKHCQEVRLKLKDLF